MTLTAWLTIYPWTVVIAIVLFADTTGEWPERLECAVRIIAWPIVVIALALRTTPGVLVTLWWYLHQPRLIRRVESAIDTVIGEQMPPLDAYDEAAMRRRAIRGYLMRFKLRPIEAFIMRGGAWHKWLLEQEAHHDKVLRSELLSRRSNPQAEAAP